MTNEKDPEIMGIFIKNVSKAFSKMMGFDFKKFECFSCREIYPKKKISLYHSALRFCCNNPFCELKFHQEISERGKKKND